MSITLAQVAKFRDDADAQSQKMFEVAVSSFFAAVPSLQFVTFKIYAPSFNDGDACLPRFQSEIAYGFVTADVLEENFDSISYVDEMVFAINLDPWYKATSVEQVKAAFDDMVSQGEDINAERIEEGLSPCVDFSLIKPEHLTTICDFHNGLLELGHNFFYDRGKDGQYVLSSTGMDVLEVEIDY